MEESVQSEKLETLLSSMKNKQFNTSTENYEGFKNNATND